MCDLQVGQFARSLAGHDKNSLYVVCGFEEERVWLSDGKRKPLKKQKRKNRKHLQPIHRYASEVLGLQTKELPGTDEQIKRAIKLLENTTKLL